MVKVGDTKKGICGDCEARVTIEYKIRYIELIYGSGVAKDILVGVCPQCDEACSLPAQSIPAVKAARERNAKNINGCSDLSKPVQLPESSARDGNF